ncbi:MAG: hypothetical protein JXP34_24840 [Planctomycetes bacterium]|nr:hypothetical protein [Planctomycetota bacterium]
MGTSSKVRSGAVVGLLSALAWAPCRGGEMPAWSWDHLSDEILPKVASRIEDFGTIVRQARAASCTVDVSIASNATPFPITGRLRYAWKDEDGHGTLTLDEVRATVDSAAGPGAEATLLQIRDQLEVQTVTSVASMFFLHDVKTRGRVGGYELTIEPVDDRRIRERLGYSRAVITVNPDCLPQSLEARMLDGSQVTVKPKYAKRGLRWRSTGYDRVIVSGAGRIEESRSDEYTDVDGVPVLARATIRSSWPTLAGVVRTEQTYTFSGWKIERRKEKAKEKDDPPEKKAPPEKKEEAPPAPETKTETAPFVPAAEVAPPEGGDADLAKAVIEKIEKEYIAPWPHDIVFFADFSLADAEGERIDSLFGGFATDPEPAEAERRPKTEFPNRDEASGVACAWLRLVLSSPLESVHEEGRERRNFRARKRAGSVELMEGEKGKYFDRILVTDDGVLKRRESWRKLADGPSPVIVHEYETETKDDVKCIARVVERRLDEKTGAVLLERTARFAYDEEFEGEPFVSSIIFTFEGKELTVKTESVD